MRKLINFLVLAMVVVVGTGCVTMEQRIDNKVANDQARNYAIAEHGLQSVEKVPPLPKNWQKIVKTAVAGMLKDPDSAKYTFPENPKFYSFSNSGAWFKGQYRVSTSPLLGYAGLVFVNAKNSYGGYTGNQPWLYMITNGEISLLDTNPNGIWHTMDDVVSHLNRSYTEALILKN